MSRRESDYSVEEIARAWLVKMRSEEADALRPDFDAWLASSPEHRHAYARIKRKLSGASILKNSLRHGAGHSARRVPRPRWRWLTWGAAGTALALLLMALGAGGAALPGTLPTVTASAAAAEPLVTRRGEIRSFRLADGSTATLDTDSRLEISFSEDARRLRLTRGRARLSVAADPRPFRVAAGRAEILAREAELDVEVDASGEGAVALWRGDAEIAPSASGEVPQTAAKRMALAQGLAFRGEGTAFRLEAMPPIGGARDWPDGWVEHRAIPLRLLIGEANRYAEVPIVIDEPAVAKMEAAGRFRISETRAFTSRIARLFDLRVIERPDAVHLRTKNNMTAG